MLFPENKINADFARCHKLIYGYPKSGKTTLAAQMVDQQGRKPNFIMTEEGASSQNVHAIRVTSWDGFKRLVTHLENNKATLAQEASTIVIDILGDLDTWASSYVAQQKRVEYVGDLEHGKGWKLLKDTLQIELSRLLALAPVTFVCHTAEKEIDVNGEKVKTQAPSLSKACLEYVNGKVDAIIWIDPATTTKGYSQLSLVPTKAAIAGCRQTACNKLYPYDPKHPGAAYQAICTDYAKAQQALINNSAPKTDATSQGA